MVSLLHNMYKKRPRMNRRTDRLEEEDSIGGLGDSARLLPS